MAAGASEVKPDGEAAALLAIGVSLDMQLYPDAELAEHTAVSIFFFLPSFQEEEEHNKPWGGDRCEFPEVTLLIECRL